MSSHFSSNTIAPVVQLVTSKPSDVGTRVLISVTSHEVRFSFTKKKCPTSGRLIREYTKFDFTVDEGKYAAKEDGEILCDLPPV